MSSRAADRTVRARRSLVALLLTATALPAGCVGGPDDPELGTVVEALNVNSRAAFDYFLGKGLTPVQAAGIVGNLMQESNCDPTAVQPGGPGRGIAQWSVGGRWDHDAGDNAVEFARSRGASVWSLALQLDFIWYELTTRSGYGLAQLRASTTVTAATVAFQSRFEGCGTCVQSQRISYANQALAAYGSDAASSWGARFVSQSFPYASAGSVSIVAGRTASVSITMRNTGSRAWDSRTCIATTQPRDRRSPFAGSEWPAPNRPACVPAGTTVANGASHTFTWTMHAPAAAGRYDERWGMVEEGAAWFSDPGQGGPPDDNLEGIFTVTTPPPPPPADAGVRDAGAQDAGLRDAGPADGSTPPDDVGTEDAAVVEDAGFVDDAATLDDAGIADDAGLADDAGIADDAAAGDGAADGGEAAGATLTGGCGCRTADARRPAGPGGGALLALALVGARRRRRAR